LVELLLLSTIGLVTIATTTTGSAWNSSSWDNGEERIIDYGQRDPFDNSVELTGIGEAEIIGNGTLVLRGDAPRFRIVDLDFENVNVTFSAKRISEDRELSYQGFVVGARSKHYTDDECYSNTYYARLTYDGRISFEKELFHGHGEVAQFPPVGEAKYLYEDGVPKNKWINIQFIVQTVDDGSSVLLELYVDREKVLEYKDTGSWQVDAEEGICNDYPHNKILFSPGFVFIRNDGLGEAQYRELSIGEL
jgi:hypothetical protein